MRIDSKLIPPNIRRLLPADHPQSSVNDAKRVERHEAGMERELHDTFANWCNLNGVPFVHSRTDRKSTIAEGWPDFTLLYMDKGCAVEFKRNDGVLSASQLATLDQLKFAGVPCLVTTSAMEAIEWTRERLGIV